MTNYEYLKSGTIDIPGHPGCTVSGKLAEAIAAALRLCESVKATADACRGWTTPAIAADLDAFYGHPSPAPSAGPSTEQQLLIALGALRDSFGLGLDGPAKVGSEWRRRRRIAREFIELFEPKSADEAWRKFVEKTGGGEGR